MTELLRREFVNWLGDEYCRMSYDVCDCHLLDQELLKLEIIDRSIL